MLWFFRNKVASLYLGPCLLRAGRGLLLGISIIPRRDLTIEGFRILAGVEVEVFISTARPRVRISLRSDAPEIAARLAEGARA